MTFETAVLDEGDAARCARRALQYLAQRQIPPTPHEYLLAWRAVGALVPAEDADERTLPRMQPLLDELTRLLGVICEAIPKLVEEDGWVRQQFDSLRAALPAPGEMPDRQALAQMQALLTRTTEEHGRLLKLRRDSLQMMKTMIAQCVEWLKGLVESSEQFGNRLETRIAEIEQAPDLPALAGAVRSLLDETRELCTEFESSRQDFAAAGAHARHLQDEIRRLADELNATSAQLLGDHLTGLMNRRGLERAFDDAVEACRTDCDPLSLALLDIDDFKLLNDRLGHLAGDEALRHLARLLQANVRRADLSARYGGEEFVLLMPGRGPVSATEVIRRVQGALERERFVHESLPVLMTFSAGITQVEQDDTLASAIARADEAMYKAKRSGKNGMCIAV